MKSDNVNHKSVTRRGILKVIGGGVILAAVGAGGFLATRDPAVVREPWQNTGQNETDPRRKVLSFAILAPNPHNRQPWLVDLVGDDEIVLYCDKDRHLPETDPYDRQITIGLGCFIETLVIAASNDGYRADVEAFPEGDAMPFLDERPVARIRLSKDATVKADPLFAQILSRRSNKEAYSNDRELPDEAFISLDRIGKHTGGVGLSSEAETMKRLRQIALDAMRVEYGTAAALGESIDLMRIGKSEIIANPDGIDLGGPFMETLSLLGQLDRKTMRDPSSYAWKTGLDMVLAPMKTGSAFGWLFTKGNARTDQINAGRDYVRFNLKATEFGIDIHPMSQALQEYPEMKKSFEAISEELDVAPPYRLQMFVRLGYGEEVKPSPRWPLAARLRNA